MCLQEILRIRGQAASARNVCSGIALRLPDRTILLKCQHAMSNGLLSINQESNAELTGTNDDTVQPVHDPNVELNASVVVLAQLREYRKKQQQQSGQQRWTNRLAPQCDMGADGSHLVFQPLQPHSRGETVTGQHV